MPLTPPPYVALPRRDSMKKRSESPTPRNASEMFSTPHVPDLSACLLTFAGSFLVVFDDLRYPSSIRTMISANYKTAKDTHGDWTDPRYAEAEKYPSICAPSTKGVFPLLLSLSSERVGCQTPALQAIAQAAVPAVQTRQIPTPFFDHSLNAAYPSGVDSTDRPLLCDR